MGLNRLFTHAFVADYNTEDLDRKLDVLLMQQKQMEKWKPKRNSTV
jgi:hypothetical protein